MGFGMAGLLAGTGEGLLDWAKEQQEIASDLIKMKNREKIRREGAEWNAEFKKKRGGGRGMMGGGGSGRPLTSQERDDLDKYYKNMFPEDDLSDAPRPSIAEFGAYIERTRKPGESIHHAADRATKAWEVRDETTSVEKQRAAFSPMRIFGDDTYTETQTNQVGGFRGLSPQPAGGGGGGNIPEAAITALRANPGLADEFDAKYGAGAAQQILGQ